jgi:Cu(I)/Ag(I) efflux system membrane protein CusA/SilA
MGLMINSETQCFVGAFYLMLGIEIWEYKEAQDKLNAMMTKMPKGYYMEWSGQWENQIRANKKTLSLILPLVIL